MASIQQIIKNNAVVDDDWNVLRLGAGATPETAAVPSGKVLVPLKVWLAQRDVLQKRADIGVWFASDERVETLQDEVAKFSVIAVDFPKFGDGRGYTIAYRLRTRFGYRGELRAIGDVLRDQLFYMRRAGFDAYAVRADKDIHAALQSLQDFSITYQASADETQPLFRRARRGA